MRAQVEHQYDWRWSPPHLWALTVLCVLAAGAVAVPLLASRYWIGRTVPVDRARCDVALERVNPNTASLASLRRLSGVGPVIAQEIIDYRAAHGPVAFTQPADLEKVRRVGASLAHNIAEFLEFPPPAGGQ